MRPVVPLGAVQQDREGKFVLLVDQKTRVALQRIKVSQQVDGNWVVDDGLKGGESLIVEGLQNVSEGVAVNVMRMAAAEGSVISPSSVAPQAGSQQ
jgi:membrane fusion protein (multidrug efflux system)